MGTTENKALVRCFVDEVFENIRPAAVDELVADDFVSHTWPSSGDGKSDLKRAMERVSTALVEPRFAIDDIIAEGDRVVVRLTASATRACELMGMPPSGSGTRSARSTFSV